MKITKTVRRLYDEQLGLNQLVEARVRQLFEGSKPEGWFYRGRIKPVESFAQKLETGRGGEPQAQEDFFACTLVVENRTAISEAYAFVERFCDVVERRPRNPEQTHKRPEAFPFDDLRLYARLKAIGPDEPVTEVLFEVQIKTFLQHAWSIATRDLIYKGDRVSWGKARVAYQVRAMLEHAEVSIAEVEAIAGSEALHMEDAETRDRNRMLDWFTDRWQPEQLPQDRRRLVDTLREIARALYMDMEELITVVEQDTAEGDGINLRDLSPYGIVIRALFRRRVHKVNKFLCDTSERPRLRLFLSDEMEISPLPDRANPERYRWVTFGEQNDV